MIRVQTWVMRFVSSCHVGENRRLLDCELHCEELNDAETQIVRKMQKEMFSEEYMALVKKDRLPKHSKFLSLCPQLDDDRIMRSDGRLKYAEFLPCDTTYSIILPMKNWVTIYRLIVKYHLSWEATVKLSQIT